MNKGLTLIELLVLYVPNTFTNTVKRFYKQNLYFKCLILKGLHYRIFLSPEKRGVCSYIFYSQRFYDCNLNDTFSSIRISILTK